MLSIAEAKAQLAQALSENKAEFIEKVRGLKEVLEELAGYTSVPDLIPEAKRDIIKINEIFGINKINKKSKYKPTAEEKIKFAEKQLANKDMFQMDLIKVVAKNFGHKPSPMYLADILKDSRFLVTRDGLKKKVSLVKAQ